MNLLLNCYFSYMENQFKTKTGFCHVTDDQIILTRDGVIGEIADVAVGNNISQILVTYSFAFLMLYYFAYDDYVKGDKIRAILYGIPGLYLLYGIFKSLNNSATSVINRKDIKSTKFIKGITGLTRSRFEIEFNENGKIRKRLIMLPGFLSGGKTETAKAIEIMKEEELLNT